MSLSKQILSTQSYQELLSTNQIFGVEQILKKIQKREITPEQGRTRLEMLLNLESENAEESKNIGNFGQNNNAENTSDFDEQEDEIDAIQIESDDDFEYSESSISVEYDDAIQLDSGNKTLSSSSQKIVKTDEVSQIFDFYMSKPVVNNSFGNNFGSPFGGSSNNSFGSNFNSSFGQNNFGQNLQFKPVPVVDWAKIDKLNDCVILYRTHAQSRALEEAFLKHKLPYRLVSGTRFLDRKEVKDVLCMLRFLANSSDRFSLSRFLPLVMTGVGPKTLDKILAFLEDYDYPLAPKYQEAIVELMSKIQSVWSSSRTLVEMVKELVFLTGYDRYMLQEYPNKEEREERMDNVKELYSLMLPFDDQKETSLESKLSQFLTQIALMSALDNSVDNSEPKISLMSLHQSKGLEFETVFLVGCEDGLLPHQNSFLETKDMEEEVRLAYVGVTRAKSNLYLTSASSRVYFGQIKVNPVSRIFRAFLDKNCKRVNY